MLLAQVFARRFGRDAGTLRHGGAIYINLPVFWIPAKPAGIMAVSTALPHRPCLGQALQKVGTGVVVDLRLSFLSN